MAFHKFVHNGRYILTRVKEGRKKTTGFDRNLRGTLQQFYACISLTSIVCRPSGMRERFSANLDCRDSVRIRLTVKNFSPGIRRDAARYGDIEGRSKLIDLGAIRDSGSIVMELRRIAEGGGGIKSEGRKWNDRSLNDTSVRAVSEASGTRTI